MSKSCLDISIESSLVDGKIVLALTDNSTGVYQVQFPDTASFPVDNGCGIVSAFGKCANGETISKNFHAKWGSQSSDVEIIPEAGGCCVDPLSSCLEGLVGITNQSECNCDGEVPIPDYAYMSQSGLYLSTLVPLQGIKSDCNKDHYAKLVELRKVAANEVLMDLVKCMGLYTNTDDDCKIEAILGESSYTAANINQDRYGGIRVRTGKRMGLRVPVTGIRILPLFKKNGTAHNGKTKIFVSIIKNDIPVKTFSINGRNNEGVDTNIISTIDFSQQYHMVLDGSNYDFVIKYEDEKGNILCPASNGFPKMSDGESCNCTQAKGPMHLGAFTDRVLGDDHYFTLRGVTGNHLGEKMHEVDSAGGIQLCVLAPYKDCSHETLICDAIKNEPMIARQVSTLILHKYAEIVYTHKVTHGSSFGCLACIEGGDNYAEMTNVYNAKYKSCIKDVASMFTYYIDRFSGCSKCQDEGISFGLQSIASQYC